MGDDGKHNPDKGIETDDSIACDMHLDAINALYGQAKEELHQYGTSDTLLSFAADLEDEARQMAEILEKQRGAERKPSYSRDTPGIPYSMLIEYSPKDLCYYVTLPEFIGYTNGQYIDSGKTYVEAAQKGEDVLAFLMETAKEECDELPKPAVVDNDDEDDDEDDDISETTTFGQSIIASAKQALEWVKTQETLPPTKQGGVIQTLPPAALPTKDYSVNLEWEGDHYDIWVAPSGRATGGVGYFNVGKTREEALRYADNIMTAKQKQRETGKTQANED